MKGTEYLQELRFLHSISEESLTTDNKDYHGVVCMNNGYMIMRNKHSFHVSVGEFDGKFFLRESEMADLMHEIRSGELAILYDEEDNLVQFSIDGTDFAKTLQCLPVDGYKGVFKLPKKQSDIGKLDSKLVAELEVVSGLFELSRKYMNMVNMFAFASDDRLSASNGFMIYHTNNEHGLDFRGAVSPDFSLGMEHFEDDITAALCLDDQGINYIRFFDEPYNRFGLYRCRPGDVGEANKLRTISCDDSYNYHVEVRSRTLLNHMEKLVKELKPDPTGYKPVYLLFDPKDGLVVCTGDNKNKLDEVVIKSQIPDKLEVFKVDARPFWVMLQMADKLMPLDNFTFSLVHTELRCDRPLFVNGVLGLSPLAPAEEVYDYLKYGK